MRSKSLTPLGETEMEVLHLVWEMDNATVAEVHTRLLQERQVAYTTIMTVMKNLANKGYLTYVKEGLSYRYSPARQPDEVQHSLLKSVLDKVFKGSPLALVQNLVQQESLSESELDELKSLIDDLDDTPPAS